MYFYGAYILVFFGIWVNSKSINFNFNVTWLCICNFLLLEIWIFLKSSKEFNPINDRLDKIIELVTKLPLYDLSFHFTMSTRVLGSCCFGNFQQHLEQLYSICSFLVYLGVICFFVLLLLLLLLIFYSHYYNSYLVFPNLWPKKWKNNDGVRKFKFTFVVSTTWATSGLTKTYLKWYIEYIKV